jgi:hypothetical protein
MGYAATDNYPPSGEQYATGLTDLCRALSGKDIGACLSEGQVLPVTPKGILI